MTARWTRAASCLAAGICLATVSGCGDGAKDEQAVPDNPVISLNSEANAWPTAEIRGALTEREGCLLIGNSVAVFPFGTKWRSPEIVFDDGTTVRVGTQVSMGGGSFNADEATLDGLPIVPVDKVKACAQRAGVTTFVWARP